MKLTNKNITARGLLLCSLLLSCLLASLPGFAATGAVADAPEGFARAVEAAEGVNTGNGYKAFRLTPDIYNAINADCSDLLVWADGAVQPYFLNNWESTESAQTKSYPLEQAASFVKDSDQYLDYRIREAASAGTDILATSIHVQTDEQFVKDLELWGSYDGLKWESVCRDTLYRVADSSKLHIDLPAGAKYTWYRFCLAGDQQPVRFAEVRLQYDAKLVQTQPFIETYLPAFTVTEDGKDTVLALAGLRHVPLAELILVSDDTFQRTVRAGSSSETLYRLPFGGQTYQQLALPMHSYQSSGDILELRIQNRDDAPITITSVIARYYANDVVFKTPSSDIAFLYFGNPAVTTAPRYDIASYKDYVLTEGYDILPPAPVQILLEEAEPTTPKDYTAVLNIVVTVAAVVLAVIILLMMRKRG